MPALLSGASLSLPDQRHLRRRMMFDHFKWDPQSEDHGVLADRPLIISPATWSDLKHMAECLAAELYAAEKELAGRPDLFRELSLPDAFEKTLPGIPYDPACRAARFMRFDFHLSNKGWLISEVNADVPGGFIEATAFTSLMLRHYPGHISAGDPSLALAQSVMSRIPDNGTIALVHATSFTDDRQVMEFLGRYFSVDGYKIHLVSPQHITWDHGRATLTGPWEKTPLDAVIRFFPSEWLVNLPRHDHWKGSFEHGATLQANSPWAVLTQSKRFPLVWDRLQTPLPTWQALLPRTCDVRGIVLEDKNWVVKPVLSRAGEGIVINGVTQDKESRKILKEVRRHPRHWVAQKRFDPVALVMDGVEHFPCLGVYVIDDAACGIYGRIASRPLIDHRAQDIAVLINKEADHE